MRKITVYLLCLTVLVVSTIAIIAYIKQSRLSTEYGVKFNSYRLSKDIYPLKELQAVEEESWLTLWPNKSLTMVKLILSNTTIPLRVEYKFDRNASYSYHASKSVEVWTELLFWNNSYRSETDVFHKVVSQDTIIQLYLEYYPKDKESNDRFYANIDTLYSNSPSELVCGMVAFSDLLDKKPKRNITKYEANEILINWGLKDK